MKKIPVLLLSLFLLLPIFIYLGNLADLPASRAVIVYLRDLVGMSASKDTNEPDKKEIEKIIPSHAHIGLVDSWRNLGMNGFEDLLQLAATPEVIQAWQTNAGNFLHDTLPANTFFSSSWSFWQVQHDKLSLVAYYQPWIDVLLILQVAEINGNYKIIAIGMTESSTLLSASSPVTTAHELTTRLEQAEHSFQTVIQNPAILSTMLTPELSNKSLTNLQQYANEVRNKLAVNAESKNIRLAILDWLETIQADQIKEIQKFHQANRDWLKQLQIVYLKKIDNENWLLAAIDHNQAERVLIAQLRITEHKARTTDIQIWDAASLGPAR